MAKTKTKKLKNLKTKESRNKKHQPRSEKKSKIRSLFKNVRLWKKVLFLGILSAIFSWLFWGIPLPTKLSKEEVPVSTKLFDRNGKLIYEIYAERKSTPVKLDELPDYIWESTVAIEDKDFYKHYGVSFTGVMRAVYKTLVKQKLQGGSTLTQQLIKNALLTPERTLKRKIREFALTLVVETIYSKDQILEMYLNQIPYGGTSYGIGAASETYFGKNAKDLTLAEATLLAGLPAAPSYYSPYGAHPELSKGRQEVVLMQMVEEGYIIQEDADKAKEEELKYAEPEKLRAPHFALWVKNLLAEKYGEATTEKGGLRVTTTLDLELQEFAEVAVATEVAKLKKQNVGNGAALVTRPATGEILAMVGSKDYFAEDEDGKVNIVFAKRQPGSSIKPLNYALAIKDKKISLSTPLADVPSCFSVTGQKAYCPVNYDGTFHGAQQARFALGNSYNIPAVRVLALNGLENFIDFATKMGITTFTDPKNYGLSLTLGGGEVVPYDMATAFGVFANQGIKQPLISILKVTDWKGKVLEEVNTKEIELTGDRILTSDVTFLISHILHDNNARSAAFGESSFLNVRGHPEVSVKTGTTNDRRDNWTIGYTEYALTLSWVGNNDNSEMSGAVSGVSGASPIWNSIMRKVLDKAEEGFYNPEDDGHAWPKQPQGVVGANVCATTGNLPDNPDSPGCPTRFEYFLKDKVGAGIETGTKDVQIDKTNGALAYPELPPELIETQNRPFLLDPLGTLVCLDCPIASASAKINYPLIAAPR
ncbi:MAG: Penicillin-binding protein, 1A family [Candidatus Woesebacteria bacterium GW2011_GWB1_39_12]|uniref:Penicillin-binding protein, 1A family n=2 Tax=Candidatus Woeseibacteriota TaxID=1752722 RepID=A0A0G0PJF2_9BACT|nr:MAG: Penicillin-binding protein, 1A family [Candidatus Woesebacteria bacterium GW2011_GWA1_39_12]KKR00268.1 MAG: Penicillin-binding protein, 1A family [Candidatus Woesebacteria bacterium GW2011_GWB1_39_12]